MKLKLEIKMDNSAFDIAPEKELGRILGNIAYRIETGETHGTVRDTNGNDAGYFGITEDS